MHETTSTVDKMSMNEALTFAQAQCKLGATADEVVNTMLRSVCHAINLDNLHNLITELGKDESLQHFAMVAVPASWRGEVCQLVFEDSFDNNGQYLSGAYLKKGEIEISVPVFEDETKQFDYSNAVDLEIITEDQQEAEFDDHIEHHLGEIFSALQSLLIFIDWKTSETIILPKVHMGGHHHE